MPVCGKCRGEVWYACGGILGHRVLPETRGYQREPPDIFSGTVENITRVQYRGLIPRNGNRAEGGDQL